MSHAENDPAREVHHGHGHGHGHGLANASNYMLVTAPTETNAHEVGPVSRRT